MVIIINPYEIEQKFHGMGFETEPDRHIYVVNGMGGKCDFFHDLDYLKGIVADEKRKGLQHLLIDSSEFKEPTHITFCWSTIGNFEGIRPSFFNVTNLQIAYLKKIPEYLRPDYFVSKEEGLSAICAKLQR